MSLKLLVQDKVVSSASAVIVAALAKVADKVTVSKVDAFPDNKGPVLEDGEKKSVGLKDVAAGLVGAGKEHTLLWKGGKEEEAVERWLAFSGTLDAGNVKASFGSIAKLNHALAPAAYLVSNRLTVADVAVYAGMQPLVAQLDAAQRLKFAHVTRWFDHIQHLSLTAAPGTLDKVAINTDAAAVAAAAKGGGGGGGGGAREISEEQKEKQRLKKEAKKKAQEAKKAKRAAQQKKAAPADKPLDVSRLDLRVAQIDKAWKHPDADSLYVEDVLCGEDAPRTVVSGLVKYIPEEQMQKQRVIIVANMKPTNMRGIKSFAMVLCASNADKTQLEFVEPPADAPLGDKIKVAGFEGEPDERLNPKKKIFEKVQPDFATNDKLEATWRGATLMTSAGPCTVKSIVGASIS